MKNQEILLHDGIERSLARWWVIVLFMILGGVAGWIFHTIQPPVYEATAIITITMRFEDRELTQYEQDYAFGAAGNVISSTDVINNTVAEAQARGISIDLTQFLQQMVAEGKQSAWELHVRDNDPEIAASLANLWAENAYAALNTALDHALQADLIQIQINSLPTYQPTSGTPDLSSELLREQRLSLGVISILQFALTSSASVPENPVLYNLGNLVLAGSLIGFILSLWVVNSYKVQRRD